MSLSLGTLKEMMLAAGATRLYMKLLAPNDNSKNQVYLGGDFSALNVIPYRQIYTDISTEGSKRERYKASISFFWLGANGGLNEAPNTQLILYPKYPEVRLSGFLKGCDYKVPLMATRELGRILLLGITENGSVIGHLAAPDSEVGKEIQNTNLEERIGVFVSVPLIIQKDSSREVLLKKLREIHLQHWIDSWRLGKNGERLPCKASNCGGHTLEAELGISANGFAEPDFMGWEVKQYGVEDFTSFDAPNPITLMTPEPTGGYYKESGAEAFIRKFGYPDKRGRPDRINFGGIYKCGKTITATGLIMTLDGYNQKTGKIENLDGGLTLISPKGEQAAIWHFKDMMTHWNKKHAKAAYVPSLCHKEPTLQYCYGPAVRLGVGTDFYRFLKAVAAGIVYYDPGIKLEQASAQKGKVKKRSQFRINSKDMVGLYQTLENVKL